MRTRTTTIAALTAAALLALTACSSDDDPAEAAPRSSAAAGSSSSSTGAAKLEQAVRAYTAALFSGDASGYDYLSARCKKQMSEAEFAATAKDAHQQYGAQKATGVTVDQLSGDLARVSYGAGNIPQFEREGQPWTREDGTWRWDACPATG